MVDHDVYVWGDGAPLKPLALVPKGQKVVDPVLCLCVHQSNIHSVHLSTCDTYLKYVLVI